MPATSRRFDPSVPLPEAGIENFRRLHFGWPGVAGSEQAILDGYVRVLEPLGWTGREAEWIALVCLHSGVFTRAQFCHYFGDAHRWKAARFIRTLVERGEAVEDDTTVFPGGAKACRIFHKPIYRELGITDVRHLRKAEAAIQLRRLLSLDYVLEHPELSWLPTETEKVAFFDSLGIDRRRLPKRLYHGATGKQLRYFALKLPIACEAKTATFVYVDPGKDTDTELRSWGDSHEWLWRALRSKGMVVRAIVVGANYKATIRAEAPLQTWSRRASKQSSQQADGPSRNDPGVKAEIKVIEEAVLSLDTDVIAKYGGLQGIAERMSYLKNLPKSSGSIGVTVDGFETWVSFRLNAQEST